MKLVPSTIPGFTTVTLPDFQPAVCVFGAANTGKTRFGCTAPSDSGLIGYLALDANTKGTIEEWQAHNGNGGGRILVNEKPLITHAEARKAALGEDDDVREKDSRMKLFSGIVKRVFDSAEKLCASKDVESIVVDNISQLKAWILFSYFGKRDQGD